MKFFRKRQITQEEAEVEYRERIAKLDRIIKRDTTNCARCGYMRSTHGQGATYCCLLFLEPEGVES